MTGLERALVVYSVINWALRVGNVALHHMSALVIYSCTSSPRWLANGLATGWHPLFLPFPSLPSPAAPPHTGLDPRQLRIWCYSSNNEKT